MTNENKSIEYIVNRITKPELIPNTRQFVDRLILYKRKEFINSLISMIIKSSPDRDFWVSDYLYALSFMIDSPFRSGSDEITDFVRKLETLLLDTSGGEISWYAGILLGKIDHPMAFSPRIAGVKDDSLFIEGRIGCLKGIVEFHPPNEVLDVLLMFVNNPKSPLQELADQILSEINNSAQGDKLLRT